MFETRKSFQLCKNVWRQGSLNAEEPCRPYKATQHHNPQDHNRYLAERSSNLRLTYSIQFIIICSTFSVSNFTDTRAIFAPSCGVNKFAVLPFFPVAVVSSISRPLLYVHSVICRWFIRLSFAVPTCLLTPPSSPLIRSLGYKISQDAQFSIHPRIGFYFRLLSSRFNACVFFLFLRSHREVQHRNISGRRAL
jgi:hypothetical protein